MRRAGLRLRRGDRRRRQDRPRLLERVHRAGRTGTRSRRRRLQRLTGPDRGEGQHHAVGHALPEGAHLGRVGRRSGHRRDVGIPHAAVLRRGSVPASRRLLRRRGERDGCACPGRRRGLRARRCELRRSGEPRDHDDVLQQGALLRCRPRPRGAPDDVGGVRGHGSAAHCRRERRRQARAVRDRHGRSRDGAGAPGAAVEHRWRGRFRRRHDIGTRQCRVDGGAGFLGLAHSRREGVPGGPLRRRCRQALPDREGCDRDRRPLDDHRIQRGGPRLRTRGALRRAGQRCDPRRCRLDGRALERR